MKINGKSLVNGLRLRLDNLWHTGMILLRMDMGTSWSIIFKSLWYQLLLQARVLNKYVTPFYPATECPELQVAHAQLMIYS